MALPLVAVNCDAKMYWRMVLMLMVERVTGTRLGSGATGDPQLRLLYADVILLKLFRMRGWKSCRFPTLAGTGFSDVDDVVLEHGQTFTRRVYFPASLTVPSPHLLCLQACFVQLAGCLS